MQEDNVVDLEKRIEKASRSELDNILREGARQMLQAAVEAEVSAYVENHKHVVDPDSGHRLVVRNGHAPPRNIQSGRDPAKQPCSRADKTFTRGIGPPATEQLSCLLG